MTRLLLLLLLVAVSLAHAETTCGLADCQVIEPPAAPAPALQAGQGIVQAATWNEAVWVTQGKRQIAVSASYGPLSTVREYRLRWSLLEPEPNQYALMDLKAAIEAAWNATPRKQTILRIIAFNPQVDKAPPTPAWFSAAAKARGRVCTSMGPGPAFAGLPAGCTWYSVDGGLFAFNPNEAPANGMSYQERMLRLIAAVRSVLNDPAYTHKVLAVDIGLMGRWGELESTGTNLASGAPWPMSNEANAKAILDAWWAIDDRIQITSNFQFAWETGTTDAPTRRREPKTGWIETCRRAALEAPRGQLAGWRNDGLDTPGISGTGWVLLPALADPVLAECWTTGAINGEPMAQWSANDPQGNLLGALDWWAGSDPYLYKGADYPPIRGRLLNGKYTRLESLTPGQQSAIRGWSSRVGPHLRPTKIVLPVAATPDEPWNILVDLTNTGTGSLLSRWHRLQVRFVDASGAAFVQDLPLDPTRLMPSDTRTAARCGLQLPVGRYAVELGLAPVAGLAETIPAYLTLDGCQATPQGAAWCPVGVLTVEPDDGTD